MSTAWGGSQAPSPRSLRHCPASACPQRTVSPAGAQGPELGWSCGPAGLVMWPQGAR